MSGQSAERSLARTRADYTTAVNPIVTEVVSGDAILRGVVTPPLFDRYLIG